MFSFQMYNLLFTDTTGPVIELDPNLPDRTTSNSPRFTWKSDEPADFKCSLDDMTSWRQCGTGLRKNGVWQGDNLDDGDHTLFVKGEDQLGNPGRTVSHRFNVGKLLYNPMETIKRCLVATGTIFFNLTGKLALVLPRKGAF